MSSPLAPYEHPCLKQRKCHTNRLFLFIIRLCFNCILLFYFLYVNMFYACFFLQFKLYFNSFVAILYQFQLLHDRRANTSIFQRQKIIQKNYVQTVYSRFKLWVSTPSLYRQQNIFLVDMSHLCQTTVLCRQLKNVPVQKKTKEIPPNLKNCRKITVYE